MLIFGLTFAGAAACIDAVVVGNSAARQPTNSASRSDALKLSSLGEIDGMAGVMVDLCGVDNFNVTSGSTCHYFIFGFGIAWTECSYVHPSDMNAFARCVRGCGSTGLCERACGTGRQSTYCLTNCAKVVDCMQTSSVASDQDTATDAIGQCLQGLMAEKNAAVVPRIPAAALLQTEQANSGCSGPDPCESGVRTVTPHISGVIYPRQMERDGYDSGREEEDDFNTDEQKKFQKRDRGPTGCVCDTKGMVSGVATGHAGCAARGGEPNADGKAYCYIKSGDPRCPGAQNSTEFQDLVWMPCKAGTVSNVTVDIHVNQEYEQIFAEGCELKTGDVRRWPRLPVASTPAPQEIRTNMSLAADPVAIQPFYRAELSRLVDEHRFRSHPLEDAWYKQFHRLFFAPGQVPEGAPLSPGLFPALLSTTPTTTSAFSAAAAAASARALRGGSSTTTTTTQYSVFR